MATFEKRLKDPTAAAITLAEELIQMPPQAAAGQLSQVIAGLDDLALRQLWRILQVMKLRENAPLETLKALLPAAEDELTRRTSTAPAADVPSLPKLEAYSGLMEQYNQTMEAHSPEHASETVVALERLLAGAEQLVAVEPVDYLRADIASYLGTVLTATANCFKVLGKVAPARACLERAIAEAEAHGLGSLADDCHLKLAELLVTQAGDFDRALRDLLPLQQSMSVREPSLARARISTLLAETCVNAGDFFAARQALQKAEDDLRKLGYAPPDPENLDRTLAGWIDTADRATTDPNAFRQALYGTQTLYRSIENIRSRTESSPDQQAVAMRMVESLVRLNNGLVARDQEIVQRDQRIIDRFGQAPGSDHPQKTEMVAFDEKLEALGGRINELFTAVQAEAPPEPLLSEVEILVEESRRLNAGRFVVALLGIKGDLLLKLGREVDAEGSWREACKDSVETGQLSDALDQLTRIVGLYTSQGDHAAVSTLCGEGIDLIERARYDVSPPYLQSAFLQHKIQFYFLGVFSAYKLGDYDLMLRRAELTKAHASLRWQFQRPAEADPVALETEIRLIHEKLSSANDDEAAELRVQRRTLWDRLAIQRAHGKGQPLPPEFSLRAVQESLSPDEAVIYYYWLRPGVLLVASIDREQIVVTREIVDEEYAALVQWMSELGEMVDPDLVDQVDVHGSHLLPEPARSMLRGKKHVLFSPHRVLHGFPFHALRWEGGYLIERLAVSYVPNLSVLLCPHPPSDAEGVLAVGTEQFAVPGLLLEPLPGVSRELDELGALYAEGGKKFEMLRDAAASIRRLRAWAVEGRLSSFRVLHLATHGEDVPTDTPMEAYLYLHDGRLDGLEISGWRLNAEVVILSACNAGKRAVTGRSMETLPGDEIFGLQAAFFSAGARRVVGALWPVADESAPPIMKAFHRHLAELAPEYALQAAIIDFLREPDFRTCSPFYWAPFFISAVTRR